MDTALDVHQHLWPEPFLAALRVRQEPPRLDRWTLHLPDEPPIELEPDDHDPRVRAKWLRDESVTAILSPSSPLGVENLPLAQSRPLLDAYHEGVAALEDVAGPDPRLGWWAALPRETGLSNSVSSRRELCSLLDRGAAGLQIPAPWLSRPVDFVALQPLLATLQEADRPLFIHPGSVPPGPVRTEVGEPRAGSSESVPGWWAPVVDYTAQMAAAWWSWHAVARAGLPTLRVCFAAGAGLAPVHQERLRSRGGAVAAIDPLTFVELSGYGPQAFDAMLRVLGVDVLVSASDHPYAVALEIPTDPAANRALRHTNPHRLMSGGMP